MTVWAFVSDVHGNHRALLRAEAAARAEGADRFVCLGDVVGRGEPDACVRWVAEKASLAVVGNRDLDHLDWLSAELRGVVVAWPKEAQLGDLVVTHGDPRLHRVLNAAAAQRGFGRARVTMAERGARIWCFGHTHRPRIWLIDDDELDPREGAPAEVTATRDTRLIVNVGTVGLPLPSRGPAAFALYDDRLRSVRAVLVPE